MGAEGRTGVGGLHQPAPWGEGQLLLCGVPGNWRGDGDGTGGQQQCGNLSPAFLKQLRARHTEPLTVIWGNSPAHRGDALRAYLATPDLNLRLVNLPSYSPDFNADEAIWGWARQEATANLCLGTRVAVQEKVGDFFARLSSRREEVKRRYRTVLQTRAEEIIARAPADFTGHANVDFTLASV